MYFRYLPVIFICFALLPLSDAMGQAKVRKLSTIINHPSLNLYAPYVSADANALVFLSDNAEDHALTPFFSFRGNADWSEPQVLPKNINTRLNFLRGYGLSADGNTLYFSTMKSPGVGGFDIFSSEWRSSVWTNPVNLGAPVNSKGHEACPSLTPDGKTLYFMRCEKMNQNSAEQCKLFRVAKKTNGLWGDPEELPEFINTGNSQTPRIMADSETLIFSSDRIPGGKGGMDLYVTRIANGTWSKPVPLAFANTENDDQYVSVTGLGRYLLRDARGVRKNELMEYLIPENLRPKGMMKIEGKVIDAEGKPLKAYISLVRLQDGERIYNGRPDAGGAFLVYAKEGHLYELGIDPEHGNRTYYSKTFDLTTGEIPQVEKVEAVLRAPVPEDEFILDGISFEQQSGKLNLETSARELKRFIRLVTGNSDLQFEIQVLFEGYQQDSVQSDSELTEFAIDSVRTTYIDIDTLGQLYERDTVMVKVIYHNDRTAKQAQSIMDYLISSGGNENQLIVLTNAIPATLPGQRRTIVKARVIRM